MQDKSTARDRNVHVTVRVPAALAVAFGEAASREDRTVSAELRRLMRQHVARLETDRTGLRQT